MIGVAAYALVIGLFLSAGGWLAERILASLRGPRRSAWISALLLSVALPAWRLPAALPDVSPVQVWAPAPRSVSSTPSSRPAPMPHRAEPSQKSTPAASAGNEARPARRFWTSARYREVLWGLLAAWVLASSLLLIRLFAGITAMRRQLRHGETAVLDGVAVTLAENVGPAVLGLRRPRIVIPRALAEHSPQRRAALLVHEEAHLRAYDGPVLFGATLLVTLLPWNLPLWWMRRRLRLALEMDCDARVVRRGFAPAPYAAALHTEAAVAAPGTRSVPGLIEPRTPSPRRIRILVTPRRPWWPWAAVPLYALTGLAVLAAGTFPAPPLNAALGARNQSRANVQQADAQRRKDARVTRRLLASGRSDALAAAAVLGWPYPSGLRRTQGHPVQLAPPEHAAQRLAWLRRAIAAQPHSVSLVLLEKNLCQAWHEHCGIPALDARLLALDPSNGVGWLDALQTAVTSNDARGIDAALRAIGTTRRVDVRATELFARLAEALHRVGGESYFLATGQLQYLLGNPVPFDVLIALERACTPHGSALAARRLTGCRAAAAAFERGDTLAISATGTDVALRLWPPGTPEHDEALRRSRRIGTLSRSSADLFWPPSRWQRVFMVVDTAGYLERLDARIVHIDARARSEQEALRMEIHATE